MKLIAYFCELEDYLSVISSYLKNARNNVWCGSYYIDFSPRLFEGESFEELLLRLDSQGVKISIRVSHIPQYPIPESLKHLVTVVSPQQKHWAANIHPIFDSVYHQKFLLIDDEYLFLGGCLFTHHYQAGLGGIASPQSPMAGGPWGAACPPPLFKYVDSALFYLLDMSHWPDYRITEYLKHECIEQRSHSVPKQQGGYGGYGGAAPPQLLRERHGLEALYQLIDCAEQYIYIHNQYLFSTDYTRNRILERVRLRARDKPELQVLVVINNKNYDHDDLLIRHLFPLLFKLSAHYVSDSMSSPNIKVCYLQDREQPVFIHDKVAMVDDVALFTSANFVDRSLERDLELGVVERDDGVMMRQTLCHWLSYKGSREFRDIWSQAYGDTTMLRPVKQWNTVFHYLIWGITRLFGINRLLS